MAKGLSIDNIIVLNYEVDNSSYMQVSLNIGWRANLIG